MKDWKLYRCINMEKAVESMSRRNRHSIVKKSYQNEARIFFRGNLVSSQVKLYAFNQKQRPYDSELELWRDHGGVLIDNSKEYAIDERYGDFGALLWVEAPITFPFVQDAGKVCEEVIVFRPPTWAEHESRVARIYPTSLQLERAYDAIMWRLKEGLTPKHRQILQDAGLDVGGHAFIASDFDLAKEVGVDRMAMTALRAKIMSYCRRYYHEPLIVLIPRIAPLQKEWLPLYRYIESMPDRLNGERFLKIKNLREVSVEYQSMIRGMAREGCLEKRPGQHVWDINPDRKINTIAVDALHRRAVAELQHLKQMVDSADSYPL